MTLQNNIVGILCYYWYIMLLCINLLLYLLLLSSTMGDNTILSFMSTFPVAIYMDSLNKRETGDGRRETGDGRRETGDIFKENKKNLVDELVSYLVKPIEVLL